MEGSDSNTVANMNSVTRVEGNAINGAQSGSTNVQTIDSRQ